MRTLALIITLQCIGVAVFAQEFLSGKLIEKQKTTPVYFDRTQVDITKQVFQTVYKVSDLQHQMLFTITITHNHTLHNFLIGIKPAHATPTGSRITYNPDECGLIFNDKDDLDTSFGGKYNYLLSFTDTTRTYPIIHQLEIADNKLLVLDPLSKLRIKKHNEIVKQLNFEPLVNTFNVHLIKLRDSLYATQFNFNEQVAEIRTQIETDVNSWMKDKRVEADVKRYEGEKKMGNPHGKGLLVLNGNIYDGIFEQGKFVEGNALLKSAEEEFCGNYSSGLKNHIGWLKSANGSYCLGQFKDGNFIKGVALQKGEEGEIYFGGYNGKRNGYGELQNSTGGKYAGQFIDGRLVRGYTKEIDPFGYYSYSRIENGSKISIDAETAEEFFGISFSAHKED